MGNSNFLPMILYFLGTPGMVKYNRLASIIFHYISVLLLIASNVHIFALFYGDLNGCIEIQCRKVIASNLILRCFLIANWLSFYLKRKHTKSLISSFKLHKTATINCRYFVNILTTAFLLFYIFQSSMIVKVLWTDKTTTKRLFERISFDTVNNLKHLTKVGIYSVYYICIELYSEVLPLLITLYYTSWCFVIKRAIESCEAQFTNSHWDRRMVSNFINEYKSIYRLAAQFESAMSRQVFFLNACHFIVVFIQVAKVLHFRRFYPSVFIEKTSFPILHTISFFAITYFAGKVHEKDQMLRHRVQDLAFHLESSKSSMKYGRILNQFIRSKEAVVFSACEIYNFKKSLLLASVGVVISYNLLVLTA